MAFGDADKSLDVLGQAAAAVTDAGVKKAAANSFVEPDRLEDHLDVGSKALAIKGNQVGK